MFASCYRAPPLTPIADGRLCPTGLGNPADQGLGLLAGLVQREAYVLAYIDAFWLIAWVSFAGLLLILLLPQPPPNPLTPPRIL